MSWLCSHGLGSMVEGGWQSFSACLLSYPPSWLLGPFFSLPGKILQARAWGCEHGLPVRGVIVGLPRGGAAPSPGEDHQDFTTPGTSSSFPWSLLPVIWTLISWRVVFPGGPSGKTRPCQCRRRRRHRFDPSVGKIPWRRM